MSVSKTKRFNESKSEEKDEAALNPQHAQKNLTATQQPQARAPQKQQQQQRQQQPQQQQRQDNQDAAPSAPRAGQVEDSGDGAGANAPRGRAQGEHDLHSPLDRMSRAASQERAPAAEGQYDVSARDVEGIRLNRFDNNMLHSANVAFMGMLSSAYQMFNQYVAPLVRPLYKTVTMDGRLWKVMRQGFTNTVDWLFANRQEIGGYLGYMKTLLFTIIKFAVGAIALIISTIGRAAGFFKDAQQVGMDRAAPDAQAPARNDNQQQQQQQQRRGGASSAGGGSISGADIAAPLLENAVSAAGKGVGMLFGAARGLFNSDVARVFKDYLTQGKAEEYVPRRDGQDARAQAHNA